MEKSHVSQRYDASARRYLRHYTQSKSILSLEKIRRAQILENHLAKVQPYEVLDFGCGSGYILCRLTQRLPTLEPFGLVLSREMLKVACTNSTNFFFTMGDIENLVFLSGKYAAVFALGVLEKFHSLNRLISEVARVIKSNGTCYSRIPTGTLIGQESAGSATT